MKKPIITFVVAIDKNRGMGNKGALPWPHIPEDFKHFHDKTIGRPMIMGRKTFESIGRVLPKRTNIIVTRDPNYHAPAGCVVATSIEEAIEVGKKENPEEIAIIGGAEIFKIAMPIVDKLYLTIIDAEFPADVYFPEYAEFSRILSEKTVDNGQFLFTFYELVRP